MTSYVTQDTEGQGGILAEKSTDESVTKDVDDTKAPPKKGRFIVKTVSKKEEDSEARAVDGRQRSLSTAAANESAFPDQLLLCRRLEQLLDMNSQVLQALAGSDKNNPSLSFLQVNGLPDRSHSHGHSDDHITELNHIPAAPTLVRVSSEKPHQMESSHMLSSATEEKTNIIQAVSTSGSNGKLHAPTSSASSQLLADKDKGFPKLFHHIGEIKKELELLQKQKKEWQLESQRLREKCQQLEDRLASESSRAASLEDRLEKAKVSNKSLTSLVDVHVSKLDSQASIIEQQNQLIMNLNAALAGRYPSEAHFSHLALQLDADQPLTAAVSTPSPRQSLTGFNFQGSPSPTTANSSNTSPP